MKLPHTSSARMGADWIMAESVFIGRYSGLTPAMLEYVITTVAPSARTLVR
jgi:hypothetical protein